MENPTNKGHRNFDFDKHQKRNFDFTKDDEDIESHIPQPSTPWWSFMTKKKFLWMVVGIGIIAGILCVRSLTNKEQQVAIGKTEKSFTESNDSEVTKDLRVEDSTKIGASEASLEEASKQVIVKNKAASEIVIGSSNLSESNPVDVAVNANISNDIEAEAMNVIRGDYGVGQERKDKLGNKYQPIQNRVNQLKRDGVF